MSLDLYLEDNACPTCLLGDRVAEFNYTYNVSKMWYHVFPASPGMVSIEEMTGRDSLPVLRKFLSAMNEDMETFRSMNPSNGWGSADGFREWIRDLIKAAEKYPDAVWSSWR